MTSIDGVDVDVAGGIGRISLDRPKAINALNKAMVDRVDGALQAWRDDPDVRVVLIDAVGERGLCAGGDIKMFHASAQVGGDEAVDFWRAEYAMNSHIAAYPKPVVALMFGTVFGGGVGIASHASHRLVTESSNVGLPEVGIGFVPDVGAAYLLSRAPGATGEYAALTGRGFGAADAIALGLADRYLPEDAFARVRAVTDDETLLELASAESVAPAGTLAAARSWIDDCFTAATVVEIVAALRLCGVPDADVTADVIERHSPEALELTLRAVRHARTLDTLDEVLAVDLAMSTDSLTRHDFSEGIRAQVIDKDRNPQWQPATLAELDLAEVGARVARVIA